MSSAGPLDQQPVLFQQDGSSGFYQLGLELPASNTVDLECILGGGTTRDCTTFDPLSTRFTVSFDLTVLELLPSPLSPDVTPTFSLLLDAPGVRRLDFRRDGTIAIAGGAVPVSTPLTVGSFQFADALAVTLYIDLDLDEWSTSLDGTEIYRDSFGGALNLERLRFGLGTSTPGTAAIDNIVVIAVPEPTTASLLGTGIGLIAIRCRRRRPCLD